VADGDVFTCGSAEFSSKWRKYFSHIRGGSENQTVVPNFEFCRSAGYCPTDCAINMCREGSPSLHTRVGTDDVQPAQLVHPVRDGSGELVNIPGVRDTRDDPPIEAALDSLDDLSQST
jgi:hypothetical protein